MKLFVFNAEQVEIVQEVAKLAQGMVKFKDPELAANLDEIAGTLNTHTSVYLTFEELDAMLVVMESIDENTEDFSYLRNLFLKVALEKLPNLLRVWSSSRIQNCRPTWMKSPRR